MRDLYDQLLAGGEAAVAQLIGQQENVALEFKTKTDANNGVPTRDDRRNLGIILSAFSNSMGGVVVWGISAAKDADDLDCATDLRPITGIDRFKAEVTRLLSHAIMPRHEGITLEAIPTRSDPQAGYLAIYVERSERRPHRCEIGEKQYFKRVGDSSIAMEHYDIEDSFKRQVVAWLEFGWRIREGRNQSVVGGRSFRTVYIEAGLQNPSSATSLFPYLTISEVRGATPSTSALSGHSRFFDGEYHFYTGVENVIHPGLFLPIVRLETPEIAVEARDSGKWYVQLFQPVSGVYRCGFYNSRQISGQFLIPMNEIIESGIPGGFHY